MENEKTNKFQEVEMLLGGLFTLCVDGVCFLIDLTGVGLFLAPIIQGATVFAIERWVSGKGGKSHGLGKRMAKYAAGVLPVLPTTFFVFVLEVMNHNNPALIETVATNKIVTGVAQKIKI